ncbi:MAG: phosphatidylserine decarboxylase family protein [Verrucomicrobiae bacterium]
MKLLRLLACCSFGILSALAKDSPPADTGRPVPYRVGEWLPSDQKATDQWAKKLVDETGGQPAPLLPAVQELKELIEGDPELFMLFTQMFAQVPSKRPYLNDPTGKPGVRDYVHMLHLLNSILTKAPAFDQTGLVGFPINAILDWPMGTPAGSAAFLNEKVNRQLKKILNQWALFLSSKESLSALSTDPKTGWLGRDALKAMPTLAEDFQCDPTAPFYGFSSWDDFFTRQFKEGKRPVASPEDDSVIANACESAPYRLVKGVKQQDLFWIKAQPYSLKYMLAGDPLAGQFDGGTIYQAFLSALSYHRWHSPVSGTIVKTRVVDGSYYAAALSAGFDPASPNESQAYITNVATRAIVFIQADNPAIGLMGLVFVGMAEVSSNEVTVKEGQHVAKGEQLGMFHFGGSTHCLLFRPQTKLKFDLHGQQPSLNSENIKIKERIATVEER